MNKRVLYSAVILALGLNLFFGAQVYVRSAEAAGKNDVFRNLRLFSLVLERVREDYVDGDKLTYQDLVYGALKGLMNTLDPHSEFLEPRKYDDFRDDTEGVYGGVGMEILPSTNGEYLTVNAAMPDTPASRAGITSGDRITRIEGQDAHGMSTTEAVKLLRGTPGSEVTVTILRPSTNEEKDYTLKREVIKVDTVKDLKGGEDFTIGEGHIGYVRVIQFGERTTTELEAAIKKLESQGLEGLVLDLRDNPGGLLDQAAKVCSLFLPPKTLVVSTEGRDPSERREYRVPARGKHYEMPMVVLINEGSASASEIVAGCLQDLKRAIIVGEKSFGKGSVQSIIELQDGAALRLTTAKYYTPSHKVIHEHGITPDIEVPQSLEDDQALAQQRRPAALESLDPSRREAINEVQDLQLERAMDLLKGITLYTHRNGKLAKLASPGADTKN